MQLKTEIVTKLYLFLINLFFTDQVYRETDLTKEYPILVEIFVDNDIVTFILCDSIDMFIGMVHRRIQFIKLYLVYFYSSRFQTPEKEVGLANFWIPSFQFLMAFIPA